MENDKIEVVKPNKDMLEIINIIVRMNEMIAKAFVQPMLIINDGKNADKE